MNSPSPRIWDELTITKNHLQPSVKKKTFKKNYNSTLNPWQSLAVMVSCLMPLSSGPEDLGAIEVYFLPNVSELGS